jgi:hypothetical protein
MPHGEGSSKRDADVGVPWYCRHAAHCQVLVLQFSRDGIAAPNAMYYASEIAIATHAAHPVEQATGHQPDSPEGIEMFPDLLKEGLGSLLKMSRDVQFCWQGDYAESWRHFRPARNALHGLHDPITPTVLHFDGLDRRCTTTSG